MSMREREGEGPHTRGCACAHCSALTLKQCTNGRMIFCMHMCLCAQECKTSAGSRLVRLLSQTARSLASATSCPSLQILVTGPEEVVAGVMKKGEERAEQVLPTGGFVARMRLSATGPAAMEEAAMRPEGILQVTWTRTRL